jgi:hypothetical protein
MAQAVSRRPPTAVGPGSIPGQSMWNLWWTKWHWDRFFSDYFGFSPVSFIPPVLHTWKNLLALSIQIKSIRGQSHPSATV